jgi:methionyl-tRNA formyltransferase
MTKIIFFGTPVYVLPILDALHKDYNIAAVVTQPPKPLGRKQKITYSPVAKWAQTHKIPVIDDPPKDLAPKLAQFCAKVGVLAAYGRILPDDVLSAMPYGIINAHPSLLPRWRGASPAEAAIAAGDHNTGITFFRLVQQMDAGPILKQYQDVIYERETKDTLYRRMFKKAAEEIGKTLAEYLAGQITLQEQDHKKATYTTLLKREHGFIKPEYLKAAIAGETFNEDWPIPFIREYIQVPDSKNLDRFIRAVTSWPGAYTEVKIQDSKTKRLKILQAHQEDKKLVLDYVQLEGKKPVSWRQFLEGYPKNSLAAN